MTGGKHYLFVMWDGGGTVPPELGVARRLIDRGHRVTVLGDPVIEPEARASGSAFRAYRHAPARTGRRPEDDPIKDWDAKNPLDGMRRARDQMACGPAAAYARDVMEAAEGRDVDVVVVDGFLMGGLCAAEALGKPSVAMWPNLDLRPAPGKPPGGMGLMPSKSLVSRVRDRLMKWVFRRFIGGGLADVNRARAGLGLEPVGHPFDLYDRATRVLMLTSRHFDFPGIRLPENTRYVGPQLDDPLWACGGDVPQPDERPLVLVTLGSTFQNQQSLFQRVIDACADLPVQAVVTLGGVFAPEAFDAPEHVSVVRSAPHAELLPRARAMIGHGGHGTTIKALAAGVPQLVIPIGRDQFDNAARIAFSGAGTRLKPKAGAAEIRTALRELLENDGYRRRACELAALIREEMAENLVIEELEALATEPSARRFARAASVA